MSRFPQLLTKTQLARYLGLDRSRTLPKFLAQWPDFPQPLPGGRYVKVQVDRWLLTVRNPLTIEDEADRILAELQRSFEDDIER